MNIDRLYTIVDDFCKALECTKSWNLIKASSLWEERTKAQIIHFGHRNF